MVSRIGAELKARALWFTAPRKATLCAETVPPPGPGEVRVETIASAVSAGTEMLVYRGEVPQNLRLDLPTFAGSYAFPIKYGYAAAGRVFDTGPSVEHLSVGDPVFVHHPHQEVFVVPAQMPVRLPEGLDPLLGVFVANLETAINVVHDTPLRFGETALVLGGGVVGLLVARLLRLAGAEAVLLVDPLHRRRKLALAAGAEYAFGTEGLNERIMKVTGGRGVDVAVEASGSGAALQAAIEAVAAEGTVVVASWHGTRPVTLDLGGHFHRGRVRLRSSQVGRLNPELAPRWDRDRRTETVIGLLDKLELRNLISHRLPFDRATEAYPLLDERPGEAVQIVFTYAGAGGGHNV
ncbi:MAG: zinc-binding alcohol dehydrogenase [Rubrobacteraceae bacterium]|nr:zinc-binding alcohol dehydrogenase [Rubrobacteraceae bacterium]